MNKLRFDRRVFLARAAGSIVTPALLAAAPVRADDPPVLPTRRIWLRLLVDQVEANVRAGQPISPEQRYFAGLTAVTHVYVSQEHRDIILEGPGEDEWRATDAGQVVGTRSGRPILQLDDFVVAWRNAVSNQRPPSVSLEHRQESIQAIQEVIRGTPQPTTDAARSEFARRLRDAWGPQDAVTGGVPTQTRFNQVMIDADWEMKRISLGLSESGLDELPAYVDLEFDDLRRRISAEGIRARKPDGGSRFWFFPAYSEFVHSEKLDAVAIPGQAVQLLTESHFRSVSQGKQITQEPSAAAKQFVQAFTQNYADLSRRNPLFADLRNLFDWVAVARLIQSIDAPRRIGWDLTFLRAAYPLAELAVPATKLGQVALRHAEVKVPQGVASVVFPARGGVSIDLARCLDPDRFRLDRRLTARARHATARFPAAATFWR